MTALIIVESAVLVVVCLLVVGLLRAYATVLTRLQALEGAAGGPPPFRVADGIPAPAGRVEGREEWAPAHDIVGVGPGGEIVSLRTVGVEHDTVLAFLSSGCTGCAGFWADLARREVSVATSGLRLAIVTKGVEEESPGALAQLSPPGTELVMSTQAWLDFAVPGSPYVVVVDGRTGRIKGEGSGQSLHQVLALITQTTQDGPAPKPSGRPWEHKPAADRARELDVDRVLLGAGIRAGDPSLYRAVDPLASAPQRPDVR